MQVDWCQFRLSNVTQVNAQQTALLFDKHELGPLFGATVGSTTSAPKLSVGSLFMRNFQYSDDESYYVGKQRHYFWDWVMVAAVPLAILLILILFLSAVFFGCREGQHWRDYKTPQ